MHVYAWIFLQELIQDWRQDRCRNWLGTSNPQLARRWVRQKLNVPDALFELVKRGNAPPEQRLAIDGRLDALRASIEKPDAERMLEVGDHFRHCWWRDPKLRGRLAHAATLRDGQEHMQIAQLEPSTDLALPVDFP